MAKHILAVNAGSSSIKFALFEAAPKPRKLLRGAIEKIGWRDADFYVQNAAGHAIRSQEIIADHDAALKFMLNWLNKNVDNRQIDLVGHRIVHGGSKYASPQVITPAVLEYLKSLEPLDPEHVPTQTKLVDSISKNAPGIKQIACFDTAFHSELPLSARLLPIPRRYEKMGVRRYGFHGLSCAYVMGELSRTDPQLARGRLIIAHLGNGVSLSAVRGGKSIDTTMSLTPASGVPMSSRSGDLDPSLAQILAKLEDLSPSQFYKMVNFKSGLAGLSEASADMQQLLALEAKDQKAKDAVDLFCYQIKKSIGALAAALGGLDGIVFTGGMGAQSPKIRVRICDGLEFLGVQIDITDNNNNAAIISPPAAKVLLRVITTDEEAVIADEVYKLDAGVK